LVLGPMLEEAFRESLMLSRGSFSIFITRPISVAFLVVAGLLLIIPIITQRKKLSTLEED
jgi:putative tricarboxylic transport membrane protein